MTHAEKAEIITQITSLLDKLLVVEQPAAVSRSKPEAKDEMLTIKECISEFKGLTEYTLRNLVNRKEIPSVRVGYGKGAKILVSKKALSSYLSGI